MFEKTTERAVIKASEEKVDSEMEGRREKQLYEPSLFGGFFGSYLILIFPL